MLESAWWGESFVNELTRISEQAEKKLRIRRQSEYEMTVGAPGEDASDGTAASADKLSASNKPSDTNRKSVSRSHTTV